MASPARCNFRMELPSTGPASSNPPEQQQPRNAGDANELNPANAEKVYDVIVLRFSAKYARSAPGILKLIQAMFVLVALIFLTTAEPRYAGYLLLPLEWHLRVFVFIAVFCFIFSLASYFVHVYRLKDMLRIDWNKFDFIFYSLLCFGLLFASSLVASTVGYYDAIMPRGVSGPAKKYLVIATVMGYAAMFLYAGSAYFAGKQWHRLVLQFSPDRFPSQYSSSQPETPTSEAPNTGRSVVV